MARARTFKSRLDRVDRKVDREPRHDDHDKAMACRDREDALRAELALFREIDDLDAELRLSWAKALPWVSEGLGPQRIPDSLLSIPIDPLHWPQFQTGALATRCGTAAGKSKQEGR
jgi:hypothetical protein